MTRTLSTSPGWVLVHQCRYRQVFAGVPFVPFGVKRLCEIRRLTCWQTIEWLKIHITYLWLQIFWVVRYSHHPGQLCVSSYWMCSRRSWVSKQNIFSFMMKEANVLTIANSRRLRTQYQIIKFTFALPSQKYVVCGHCMPWKVFKLGLWHSY